MRVRFLPLALLVVLVAIGAWRLATPSSSTVASHLIGQPAPALTLAGVLPDRAGVTLPQAGQPRLVNFFASWCVPCIAEAPLLDQMKRDGLIIDGIAVRDSPTDVAAFLANHGDPYRAIGADPDSRAQLAIGSAGVPETFLIDARGIIRFQKIGPIEAADLPVLRRAWEAAK